MPLHKKILTPQTQIFIWKIDESYEDLLKGLSLSLNCKKKLSKQTSITHKKGTLSIRKLLVLAGYNINDLKYNSFGMPFLKEGKHISISHSYRFAILAISQYEIGVDVEKIQKKIGIVTPKFLNSEELETTANNLKKQTIFWTIKESVYKLVSQKGLSLRNQIAIINFNEHNKEAKAKILINTKNNTLVAYFFIEENFVFSYVQKS